MARPYVTGKTIASACFYGNIRGSHEASLSQYIKTQPPNLNAVYKESAAKLRLKPGRLGRHKPSRIRNCKKLPY